MGAGVPRLIATCGLAAILLMPLGTTAAATSAEPSPAATRPAAGERQSGGGGILYDQRDNDAGELIVSQNFQDSFFDTYDSSGADDFVVPSGETWKIRAVDVTGHYFSCSDCGPATSQRVRFYRDAGGSPGPLVATFGPLLGVESDGSFTIPLGPDGPVLSPGTYWVAVQINMPYICCGEWGWETRTVQGNAPAAWKNPRDGFETGCTTWHDVQECVGDYAGPDFMFAIRGIRQQARGG